MMAQGWDWIPIRGDGSDARPALGRWFEAKRRDGGVERELCVTPFCMKLQASDLFRRGDANGHPRPYDLMAIRFYDNAPDAAKREGGE